MTDPDWGLAGQAVQRAIDSLGMSTEEAVAEFLGVDEATVRLLVTNGYKRGPQRPTLLSVDTALTNHGTLGWYLGRTKAIATGADNEFSLHALTADEVARLQAVRNEK